MKNLKLNVLLICLTIFSLGNAQKLSKISKSINVDKDVKIDLNTSYVQIEVDTWDKDVIEIEAYIESDKLSKEDLQKALENWNIEVEGSGDYVKIYSKGFTGSWHDLAGITVVESEHYGDLLRDLELKLADMPELPEMPELLELAKLPTINLGDFPELPEMPEFPELPELPEGVNSINFDYDRYKKEGESYLEKWSQEYEKKYGKEYKERMKVWAKRFAESGYQEKMEKWGEEFGKRFEGKWAKDMEEWGEKFGEQFGEEFGKSMEKWGQELEKSLGKDFEKKMEKWGEKFGKEMEKYAQTLERRLEQYEAREGRMEERRERLDERREELDKRREERRKELELRLAEREEEMQDRREALKLRFREGGERKVKKTIKIKMPKDAKLNLNVRHGELKFSSVIYDLNADLSHSTLLANSIDGNNTSINASYSSILVDNWKYGDLNLKYVEDASLKIVEALMLTSNSSNIDINELSGTSIIDGSFGELSIHNIKDSFKNLTLVLENSEALVKLPKTTYNLQYKGNASRLNHPENNSGKSVKSFSTGNLNSAKTIVVNAKFSDVVMQ